MGAEVSRGHRACLFIAYPDQACVEGSGGDRDLEPLGGQGLGSRVLDDDAAGQPEPVFRGGPALAGGLLQVTHLRRASPASVGSTPGRCCGSFLQAVLSKRRDVLVLLRWSSHVSDRRSMARLQVSQQRAPATLLPLLPELGPRPRTIPTARPRSTSARP